MRVQESHKIKIYFLFISIFLLSCGGENHTEAFSEDGSETFQSYRLSINSEKKKLASLIESIEVTPLEETDQSLLTSASRVLNHGGEYLVINKGDEEIVFFDSGGNYLKTFNRLGQGPGEYESINTFWVQDSVLSIYERRRSFVFRYTLEGDFLESLELPLQVGHIREYADEYVVEFNFNAIGDSLMYKFGTLDEELRIKDLYLKTDDFEASEIWSNENSVIPYNNGLLLMRMYCDTAYYYKQGRFEPLIHFNFGEDWYWEAGKSFKQNDYDLIRESGQAWDIITSLSDNLIYVRTVIALSHYEHFLIDRYTGDFIRLDMSRDAELGYAPYNLGWEDGAWLVSMSPDDILFLTGEMSVDIPNIDQISQSENPALVKIKFKDSSEW